MENTHIMMPYAFVVVTESQAQHLADQGWESTGEFGNMLFITSRATAGSLSPSDIPGAHEKSLMHVNLTEIPMSEVSLPIHDIRAFYPLVESLYSWRFTRTAHTS